jgi:hypothetical protein
MAEILFDMPFAEYLARDAYGSSDIQAFKAGPPAMVPWRRANHTDTDATRIGQAAHCKIIDPHLFAERFYQKEEGEEFRTKEAKAKRNDLLASGKVIISHLEAREIDRIVSAFKAHQQINQSLLRAAGREASIFWTCAQSGLPRRVRPDWFDGQATYDLKVTVEATKGLETLRWKAYRNGWMHQLAGARAGLREAGKDVKVGRLVVIAPTPPQHLRIWGLEVSEHDLDILELDNENWCREMAVCHQSGVWPGVPSAWQPCPLPADHLMGDILEGAVDGDADVEIDEEVDHVE